MRDNVDFNMLYGQMDGEQRHSNWLGLPDITWNDETILENMM